MAGAAATTAVKARIGGWLVGIVGSSEVGTMVVGGTLIDITADVRGFQDVNVSYGISGTGPLDRVAGTGTMTFGLNNSATNSTGNAGAYSPGHTNARAGWDIGAEIVLEITYDSVTYTKHVGTLVDIQPDAGKSRQGVVCTSVDWIDDAARAKIKNVTIQNDKRADELIDTLVTESVSRQPRSTAYSTGQSTFEISLDNLLDAQTSVLRGMADCVISELGYLYIKGSPTSYTAGGGGVLTMEDRHARPKAGLAKATFDNTMGALSVQRAREQMINRVYVVVHPRTTAGSNTVLFELSSTGANPEVPANDSITINCPFKDTTGNFRMAASTLVTPASGVDWISNSAADGGGSNLTSDTTVSIKTQAANSVELLVENANTTQSAYLTTLQVRGISVKDVSETVVSAVDTSSAFTYGEIDTRIDLLYEQRAGEFASALASWILQTYKDPRYTVTTFTIQNNKSAYNMLKGLSLEPGDKLTFSEDFTGISATGASGAEIGFFINGISMSIKIPGTITTSWTLAPASSQAAWVLNQVGASELGISTALGFA